MSEQSLHNWVKHADLDGGSMTELVIFGEAEENVRQQIETCARVGDAAYAVLCADNHLGYAQPIGGVVAYRDRVSVSGVGYDIACGNKAIKTDIQAFDLSRETLEGVADEIWRRISFGIGKKNPEAVEDHPVLDEIARSPLEFQREMLKMAREQLGTVGSGNHYVDLLESAMDGSLWAAVHMGSRGFGYRTASGFMARSQGKAWHERPRGEPMMAEPILLPLGSDGMGTAYLEAMKIAGDYAYAGRDTVLDTVLAILGAKAVETVHNHHNFAWREEHFGEPLWVVRKGATPAFPGQRGFVGGSMSDIAVITEGVDTPRARHALFSTVHGAGRVMSRTQAAGRKRFKPRRAHLPGNRGLVDWPATKAGLEATGLILRGGGADEAPQVYRSLAKVLAAHKDAIKVVDTLRPLVVVMAGENEFDPYKD